MSSTRSTDHASPADRDGDAADDSQTVLMTVSCPPCDVTWRGTVDDECWSCGGLNVVAAGPAVVKVPSATSRYPAAAFWAS